MSLTVKHFKLGIFGIVASVGFNGAGKGESGSITSNLHEEGDDVELFNAAMDGIESLVLAHAVSGVNVCSEEYVESVKSAVEACANNF